MCLWVCVICNCAYIYVSMHICPCCWGWGFFSFVFVYFLLCFFFFFLSPHTWKGELILFDIFGWFISDMTSRCMRIIGQLQRSWICWQQWKTLVTETGEWYTLLFWWYTDTVIWACSMHFVARMWPQKYTFLTDIISFFSSAENCLYIFFVCVTLIMLHTFFYVCVLKCDHASHSFDWHHQLV